MALFAHPDDEAYGVTGTLARYRAEGGQVVLISATRGEVGENLLPQPTGENLAEIRERELTDACQAIGIPQPLFLGYRDSGMHGRPEGLDPLAFRNVPEEEALDRIVYLLREHRPQVLITFDPGGGYGHDDHVRIHRLSVEGMSAAADPARFPAQLQAGLEPHRPQKLYYMAFPRSLMRAAFDQLRAAGLPVDFGEIDADPLGTPDELVTTRIDVSPYIRQKLAAIRAHRSQQGPTSLINVAPEEALSQSLGTEYYVRAIPPATPGAPAETDLFDGLTTA